MGNELAPSMNISHKYTLIKCMMTCYCASILLEMLIVNLNFHAVCTVKVVYDIVCILTHRWLYWVDRGKETLEVAAVTGEGRQVLESGRRFNCAWPLTLDYTKHTIYWINHCDLRMLSINMDGSQNTRSEHARNIRFSYGISILNDTAFWTQGVSACSVDLLQRKPVTHIIQTLNSEGGTRGIEAVHPMQQPTGNV